jgi:nitrogen fixation/metabolism regulation signal transduction histidine kinase
MKIKHKINLSFFFLSLIAGIIFLISFSYYGQNKIEKIVGEDSVSLAREAMDNIDHLISMRIEDVQAYAQDLSTEELLIESNYQYEQMQNRDEYIKEIDQQWRSDVENETNNDFINEISNNSLSRELAEEFELKQFYKEKYGFPIFEETIVTNKYGVNIAQTRKTSDFFQADEDWWSRLRQEEFVVETVQYDQSSGTYSIPITTAIKSADGEFIGVIGVSLDFKEIISLLGRKNLYQDLIDEEYTGQENENYEELFFELITEDGKLLFSNKREYEILEDFPEEIFAKLLSTERDGGSNYFIEGENDELLFAYAHSDGYQNFKGLEWILIAENSVDKAFSVVYEIRTLIIIILSGTLLGIVLLGNFFSGLALRSLEILRRGAEEIAKGNFEHRTEINSNDETGRLSKAFDKMIIAIKKSRSEVDEKVEKQTEKLEKQTEELEEQQTAILNILEDVEEEKENTTRERDKIEKILHSIGDAVFVVDTKNGQKKN